MGLEGSKVLLPLLLWTSEAQVASHPRHQAAKRSGRTVKTRLQQLQAEEQTKIAAIEVLVEVMQDPWLDRLRLDVIEGGVPSHALRFKACPALKSSRPASHGHFVHFLPSHQVFHASKGTSEARSS